MNNDIAISAMIQHLSPTLLLKFFLIFSRFEYALKASGYFDRTCRNAKPDWNSFKELLRDSKIGYDEELRRACKYILAVPPRKQVIINGKIDWERQVKRNNQTEIEFLIEMVRCIRNNLFHGAKYNNENTKRTELLLKYGLLILDECLRLAPRVKKKYDEANIIIS